MENSVGAWSLLPPVLAIALSLLTREIVLSLFVAIFSGCVVQTVLAGGNPTLAFKTFIDLVSGKFAENVSLVLFLALLGALVSVITRAGGARAYGDWAFRRLKDERTAGFMTILMGLIIFIDDYFNCLSVGTVMRPVADKFKMSRAKLAYLIDTTAAPVCIVAPVSSWAVFVISQIPAELPRTLGMSGMEMFLRAAPFNFYAIFSLVMVFWIAMKRNSDFGPMARMERVSHRHRDIGAEIVMREGLENVPVSGRGRVIDLVAPILILIVLSTLLLLDYDDSGLALALASLMTTVLTFILVVPRRVIGFHEFAAALLYGIKTMVPALVLLSLAWGIAAACDMLGTGAYLTGLLESVHASVAWLPVLMFAIAAVFAFTTGASWAAIGILVPIGMAVCTRTSEAAIVTLAATLAGSVMGDHCSPIADTTILSSTGAQCKHLNHVMTQIPYAAVAGAFSVAGFLLAGLLAPRGYATSLAWSLGVTSVAFLLLLFLLTAKGKRRAAARGLPGDPRARQFSGRWRFPIFDVKSNGTLVNKG
ncbi:MAG: Na+/H+ antiporter NhaC family protein [Kiritimatiellia bacterium]